MMPERLILMILYVLLAPFVGALLAGIDRKISARMQRRVGPPVLQPLYDVIKLFKKQVIAVDKAQGFLIVSYTILTVITGCLFFFGIDILMVFFILTTSSVFLYLAACVTGSPMSSMAAQRELVQDMAVEPALLFSAVGFYLATGTFDIGEIISQPISAIAKMPGFFVAFVFVLTVKMRKSPFDTAQSTHAHQELVKGITTEMGARNLGFFEITEWYETILLISVIAVFIINRNPVSILVAVLVVLFIYFLEILIDNTCARLKWKDMLILSWTVTLICAGANLIILMVI
ncbi:MAG: respiratory chain complex I subunit 1 family protein [Bilifractor sp.]|jgi:ech hydrogenase subunit B